MYLIFLIVNVDHSVLDQLKSFPRAAPLCSAELYIRNIMSSVMCRLLAGMLL